MPTQLDIDRFTLAFHRLAVPRLQTEPGLVQRALQTLDRWREQRGLDTRDTYGQEWRELLTGDLVRMEQTVCAQGAHAATLRGTSPLGFVLTPQERSAARRAAGL
jgi:hypothetical protein